MFLGLEVFEDVFQDLKAPGTLGGGGLPGGVQVSVFGALGGPWFGVWSLIDAVRCFPATPSVQRSDWSPGPHMLSCWFPGDDPSFGVRGQSPRPRLAGGRSQRYS